MCNFQKVAIPRQTETVTCAGFWWHSGSLDALDSFTVLNAWKGKLVLILHLEIIVSTKLQYVLIIYFQELLKAMKRKNIYQIDKILNYLFRCLLKHNLFKTVEKVVQQKFNNNLEHLFLFPTKIYAKLSLQLFCWFRTNQHTTEKQKRPRFRHPPGCKIGVKFN